MAGYENPSFVMFGAAHMAAIGVLCLLVFLLFISRGKWSNHDRNMQLIERLFAVSLLIIELCYHIWMITTDRWNLGDSLPLELCSISLLITIYLLWTGNKHLYSFVFFAGIGGAIQAVVTPVLDVGFPHFRYFHFFYTHIGIIVTAFYFTWIKGYRPTFKGIIETMVVLNVLLPLVFVANSLFQGNYMFLRMKPSGGSLLDYLGPYPWYILALEGVTFLIFVCLWLLFRKSNRAAKI